MTNNSRVNTRLALTCTSFALAVACAFLGCDSEETRNDADRLADYLADEADVDGTMSEELQAELLASAVAVDPVGALRHEDMSEPGTCGPKHAAQDFEIELGDGSAMSMTVSCEHLGCNPPFGCSPMGCDPAQGANGWFCTAPYCEGVDCVGFPVGCKKTVTVTPKVTPKED